jgi:hypothetical protein
MGHLVHQVKTFIDSVLIWILLLCSLVFACAGANLRTPKPLDVAKLGLAKLFEYVPVFNGSPDVQIHLSLLHELGFQLSDVALVCDQSYGLLLWRNHSHSNPNSLSEVYGGWFLGSNRSQGEHSHLVRGCVTGVDEVQTKERSALILAQQDHLAAGDGHIGALGVNSVLLDNLNAIFGGFDGSFVLANKFAGFGEAVAHNASLLFNGGQLPLHRARLHLLGVGLTSQDRERVPHFPQLFPIYGGLNQNRYKKRKVKKNKWIRPAVGLALIVLAAIPGLPGFAALHNGRLLWAGLLICISGALVLYGTHLALTEPETERKK